MPQPLDLEEEEGKNNGILFESAILKHEECKLQLSGTEERILELDHLTYMKELEKPKNPYINLNNIFRQLKAANKYDTDYKRFDDDNKGGFGGGPAIF
jgi:hypothetical protein